LEQHLKGFLFEIKRFISTNRLCAVLIFAYFSLTITGVTFIAVLTSHHVLTHIEIEKLPDKIIYTEKELFVKDGIVVRAYYTNNKNAEVYDYALDGYILELGNNLITVTYKEGNIKKTSMFKVFVVERTLERLELVTNPDKLNYIENTLFDTTGMIIQAVYDNGEIAIVTDYVYNTVPLTVSDKTVVFSYTESAITKTTSVNITVVPKKLTNIVVTVPPSKTHYSVGSLFNHAGMVITASYDNGETNVIMGYTYDKTESLQESDSSVVVSYIENGIIKTTFVPIIVDVRSLIGLEISSPPAKLTYVERTYFDTMGLVIAALYSNGDINAISTYTYDLDGLLEVGERTVIVSYTEGGVTLSMNIEILVVARSLVSIEITKQPSKLLYIERTSFDTMGLIVTAIYDNNEYEVIDVYSYDKAGLLALDDTEITVTYVENDILRTATINIIVLERSLIRIDIVEPPAKTIYVIHTYFEVAGLVLCAVYSNGESAVINSYTYNPIGLLTDEDTVVVSYSEGEIVCTTNISISVVERTLVSIAVTMVPKKTVYVEHTYFEAQGMVVTATYDNGETDTIIDYTYDIVRRLEVSDTNISFFYAENDIIAITSIPITVDERRLVGIEITAIPTKLVYVERTYFDVKGVVITATYDNAETAVVENYSYDKVGALILSDTTVIFTYIEGGISRMSAIGIAVIERSATNLEFVSLPSKKSYIEGDLFDPTGIIVRAYFDNGEVEYVSGWDYNKKLPLQVTDLIVTISYGGRMATFQITISPKILTAIMASSLPQNTAYIEGEYFDFLGLEIYANYQNAPTELILNWDYDKKEPLAVLDTQVLVSYSLHGMTKTLSIPITVAVAPPAQTPDEEHLAKVLALLPPTEEITVADLMGLEYALSLMDTAESLTPRQQILKDTLDEKLKEILNELPTVPQTEYTITYAIDGGMEFYDISYDNNPTKYLNSLGAISLSVASSEIATAQGYEFTGWMLNGQSVTHIQNLSGNVTIYAVFAITATVNISYLDYDTNSALLFQTNVTRESEYNFEQSNVALEIYLTTGVLPIAYYSSNKERLSMANFSFGMTITIYAKTVSVRELHLADSTNATVAWAFDFTDNYGVAQSSASPATGIVFVVPIGATVTITALHANVVDILVDGIRKGQYLNSLMIQAVFVLATDIYPASITFATELRDIITISFVGYNQHAVVYPIGWDGHLNIIDLDTIAFIYDEASVTYLTIYG
jgi:hypothetical protein